MNQSTPLFWRAAIKICEAAIICSLIALAAPGLAKRVANVVVSIPGRITTLKTELEPSSPSAPVTGPATRHEMGLPPGMSRMK